MFTGLIEEVGVVASLDRGDGNARLAVRCGTVVDGAALGDSIAVNGCCLTITSLLEDRTASEGSTEGGAPRVCGFTADMMGETLDRTALGDLAPGDPVNLERAMLPDTRMGGHLVQGHVDGITTIRAIEPHEEWTTVTYDLPANLARYVVEKGSITVDGTSLTVAGVDDTAFSVGLIPHTMAVTTHGDRRVGDRVNLEVDVIAKYVERQLAAHLDRVGPTGAAAEESASA